MNLKISQENLARAIATAMPAVAARSTLPILGSLLLTADGSALNISATNLEIGIVTHAPAQITTHGAIAVPAAQLAAYVNALPPDVVELSLNDKTQTLKIQCANYLAEFKGVEASEFPSIPNSQTAADRAGIEPDVLKELIARAVLSAAQDDARPVLVCVQMAFNKTRVQAVSADGFRLGVAYAQLTRAFHADVTALVPAVALSQFARLLKDQEEPVFIAFSPSMAQIIFELADTTFVANLQDGNFPDFNQILPKSHAARTTLNASELANALKAQTVFARYANNIVRIEIQAETKNAGAHAILRAQNSEYGQGETTLQITQDGKGMTFAVNSKFIADAVNACNTPQIIFELNDPASPVVVKPVGHEQYLYVVMPMHLASMDKPIR